ncbi:MULTISPECIES: signal recognition particle-docking protein FtsY [unclassified Leptolyngbya]|uniref:signal recognition particle-docking protein FtsY n=1 Tax=unclassified Leptolyngbya TaxID=2650499 RepID=UPI0016879037|nr:MULTISPECIES: signal recognition particle-docking protein FtsY [unclassified Leptolyngbya]MBD1911813.1 signal recognition particle-docking protein FtsY [Leptolyngbya sp. FACHB-8]MBD2153297.1 signal recognition particle-docking protein FtsY [Leptolyngbya sp. FACHB-16]
MSSFNWFNRQFTDSTPAPEEAASQPSEAPQTDAPAEVSPEDYLKWAKAAYKNIQKRQQEEVAPEATTSTEAEAPAAEPVAAEVATDVASETEPVEAPSTAEVTPVVEPVAAVEATPVEAIAPEPAPVPVEPVLPLWARAEAERQERLERLKAEAIEEPIAEPVAAQATTDVAEAELDENFLWSARVLAAQGRRADEVDLEEITWLKRLRQGLDKTRRNLLNQLRAIVGQGPLNQDAVMEIEALLLQADVGVEATDYIIEALQARLREDALPPEDAIAYLKQILRDMLDNPGGKPANPTFAPEKETLNIWLMTGVNGAGKTTTIGKIAHIAQKSGYKTLIGAADTFRAAAVEQVKIWGQRSNVEVIANPGKNTDPAAVVFDAISAAQSRDVELLLIDTAGRLQNKKNLMDELSKVRRIIDKKAPGAHVESLLVLDATLGQNGLRQAEVFSEAANLSGVILTKLDGTAKGGVALAVVKQLGLPIRFIGAGEGIEDLRPFSSYEFVEALLSG